METQIHKMVADPIFNKTMFVPLLRIAKYLATLSLYFTCETLAQTQAR